MLILYISLRFYFQFYVAVLEFWLRLGTKTLGATNIQKVLTVTKMSWFVGWLVVSSSGQMYSALDVPSLLVILGICCL